MVRLGRLERPTSCFGGTRSIQLSYSRVLPLYHGLRIVRIAGQIFHVAIHSSKIFMPRVQPAAAPRIFEGKQAIDIE